MSADTYEVGQALVYVPEDKRRGGPEPVLVTKVARKWISFAAEGRRLENRFDRATGRVDGGGYSSPGNIYRSMEAYREELGRDQALLELRERLDWRSGPLPTGITAQRVRLAMGLLLIGGDTDPLEALREARDAMKRVLPQARGALPIQDLERAIRLIEQLGINGPQP
jgi:hypothetical protein